MQAARRGAAAVCEARPGWRERRSGPTDRPSAATRERDKRRESRDLTTTPRPWQRNAGAN